MNKSIIIIICLLVFSLSKVLSQDLNNNFIGAYQCKVINCRKNQFGQYDCQEAPGSVQITFTEVSDTSINVCFPDNSHFALTKDSDSSYIHSGAPYISALFYSTDSLKLSRVHSSVGYDVYLGKKNSNSIMINSKNFDITPYPNPFDNQIVIENFNDKNSTVYILDLKGIKMNTKTFTNGNDLIIVSDKLAKGIYFLWIISEDSKCSYKIVKL